MKERIIMWLKKLLGVKSPTEVVCMELTKGIYDFEKRGGNNK